MPGVPGEHVGITAILTQVVVGGWTTGTETSLESLLAGAALQQGVYAQPLTTGLAPSLRAPHSTSATQGETVTVIRGSFAGVRQWGNLSSREPSSPPWVWREKNDL